VAGLSSVDPSFPIHLWDRLLTQAEITLNLLSTSQLHPQLSAAAHYHGLVDCNKKYFAPPGCKIIAHEKPGKRRAWSPHGQHKYSLGPAMHHYRCQNIYISTTASKPIVDTLELFPQNYQMTQLSSKDRLLMAAKDMTDALQSPHPEVPFASVGDNTIAALTDLAAIFKLKLRQAPSLATQNSPAKVVPRPRRLISPNIKFVHAHQAANPITNDNSHPRHHQCAINSKGGHTRTLRQSTPRVPTGSQRLSPRNLSQDDFCGIPPTWPSPSSPLFTTSPIQCSYPPSHRKINGILGAHERSPSTTALDSRFWQ
jgi:hypothetical protein